MKWVRNLRRNDMQRNSNQMLFVALFASGDNVCLAKSEHRKYPAGYDIANVAKEYQMGDKGNLVVYTVGTEGEVRKQHPHRVPNPAVGTIKEKKMKDIEIKGARANNLKNIDVTIPQGKLVVITGLSGSGKSSLAFDTLFAEGQRRYVESLSS